MNGRVVKQITHALLVGLALGQSGMAWAFDSGSTGADGAFTPTVNTQLALPPDGIFNFTSVNIPAGVTITFGKNTTNTPVTILASGDVTIAGTIDISGGKSPDVGAAGDGNVGDDGLPGVGGPGGFNGGAGGILGANRRGGNGIGPGAGGGGNVEGNGLCGGAGGGFGTAGSDPRGVPSGFCRAGSQGAGGASYGVPDLLPLIGGSGGGGGASGTAFRGSAGGGGGGAILIASSTTVNIAGSIVANGGVSGASSGGDSSGTGGGGSGGAVRIVATTIEGNGTIIANGGTTGASSSFVNQGGNGAIGRIRLEAETITRTAATLPPFSFEGPQEVFVAGLPGLRITRVAGVDAPASPTGNADIVLPSTTPNPVTVEFATSGVPLGNTVLLTVTPNNAASVSAISNALSGTVDNATASVNVELPPGPSVFSASVSFTVTASIGDSLSNFAKGERVERVVLAAGPDGSNTTFISISGKAYTYPSLKYFPIHK